MNAPTGTTAKATMQITVQAVNRPEVPPLKVSGTLSVGADGAIKIESAASIEIKVGGSFIKISPAGVEIKGAKVDVVGDGPVTVKGAVVKVNS